MTNDRTLCNKLKMYARAAQYSYFDHNIRYKDWVGTGDRHEYARLFEQLTSPPMSHEFKDKDLGYFVVVLETSDETIITFPGTRKTYQGLLDLDCDFDLMPTETKVFGFKCKIHTGFLDRYRLLRAEILSTLLRVNSQKQLTLVGHSLGGVLAILTSLELRLLRIDANLKVVVFGLPKFGCQKLTEMISQTGTNVIRVSNKNDPMVHLLPYNDFEYIGTEIAVVGYDKTWISLYCLSLPLLLYILSFSISGFVVLLLLISLHGCSMTHSMVNYAQALDRDQPECEVTSSTDSEGCYAERTAKTCLLIPIHFVILIAHIFRFKNYVKHLCAGK